MKKNAVPVRIRALGANMGLKLFGWISARIDPQPLNLIGQIFGPGQSTEIIICGPFAII